MARRHTTLVVAATTILAVILALGAPVDHPAAATFRGGVHSEEVAVFWSLLDGAMTSFQSAKSTRSPTWLDWTDDGCSTSQFGPGNTGRSFNFRTACQRHDFGYRNVKRLSARHAVPLGTYWTSANRRRIDDRFLADMRADCARRHWTQRSACRSWAYIYYRVVRAGGGP